MANRNVKKLNKKRFQEKNPKETGPADKPKEKGPRPFFSKQPPKWEPGPWYHTLLVVEPTIHHILGFGAEWEIRQHSSPLEIVVFGEMTDEQILDVGRLIHMPFRYKKDSEGHHFFFTKSIQRKLDVD